MVLQRVKVAHVSFAVLQVCRHADKEECKQAGKQATQSVTNRWTSSRADAQAGKHDSEMQLTGLKAAAEQYKNTLWLDKPITKLRNAHTICRMLHDLLRARWISLVDKKRCRWLAVQANVIMRFGLMGSTQTGLKIMHFLLVSCALHRRHSLQRTDAYEGMLAMRCS